ncbi:MAG TPA: cysteine desulfurase [Spirochaetia bacterium]|nr:cysteine desulfurase [Spirochaetia bacterium]
MGIVKTARDLLGGVEPRLLGGRTVTEVRGDFPILERLIGGKPLAYLDNAATSQKPRAVLNAIRFYYENYNANVHRALHTLGEEATGAFERSRARVQTFINARSSAEIIFTRGTTESINLVASTWGQSVKPGDVVLLTQMEHHSNLVPWQMLSARTGCTLSFIPIEPDGSLDLGAVERDWDDRVRLLSVAHVSNVLGTINDVKRLASIAHAHGALVLVDGAQSVPHDRVDVRDLDCDFLAFSSHKMCGPMGMGVLYGRQTELEKLPPWMGGGEMIRAVWPERSTWNDLPWRLEAGTPNVEGAIGLASAIEYLEGIGFADIAAWEAELSRYAAARLSEVKELKLHGTAARKGAVFSFSLGSIHPHDVAQFLDREGIAVRAGHHCAQPLMRALGVPATARASLYFYNTAQEIDRLAEGLEGALRFYA